MRYLQLTLASDGAILHPLFSLLTDSDCVDSAWMLDWNAGRRETTTTLFRIVGDSESFATALDAHAVVLHYEVTPSEDGTFYAYLHTEAVEMDGDCGPRSARNARCSFRRSNTEPMER